MDFCEICETLVQDRENDLVGVVCDDCAAVEFGDFYGHDGQPDEAQEWHDFDPDC
jgi:hypothetical protein